VRRSLSPAVRPGCPAFPNTVTAQSSRTIFRSLPRSERAFSLSPTAIAAPEKQSVPMWPRLRSQKKGNQNENAKYNDNGNLT